MLLGTKIALHFSIPLDANTNIDKNDFQFFLGGVSKTIDSVSIVSGYLIIDHSETITNPKLIKVNYTKNADSSKNIGAPSTNGGGMVDSFSAVDNIPPRVVQQIVKTHTNLELVFDDYIVDNSNIDKNDFDLKISNVSKPISSVSTSNGRISIIPDNSTTLSNPTQFNSGTPIPDTANSGGVIPARMCAVNTDIYIVGYDFDSNAIFLKYDTINDSYTSLNATGLKYNDLYPKETPLVHYGKFLYAIQGWQGYRIVMKYDLYDDSSGWSIIWNETETSTTGGANSVTDKYVTAHIHYGNCVYIFGGRDTPYQTNTYYDDLWKYDLINNTWTLITNATGSPPPPQGYMGYASHNDILYIVGGWGGTRSDSIWKYDVTNNHWTEIANNFLGHDIDSTSVAYHGDNLYIFSGYNNAPNLDKLWKYDLISNTVSTGVSFNVVPRRHPTSVKVGSKWYIFGGYATNNYLLDLITLDLPNITTFENLEDIDVVYTKNATSSKNIVDEAGNAAENFSSLSQSNEFRKNYTTDKTSQWHYVTFNRNKGTSSDELNSGNFVYNTEGSTEDTMSLHKFIIGYKETGMTKGIIVGNLYDKTKINDYGAFILDNATSSNPVKIENNNNVMVGVGSYTTNGSKMVKSPHFRFAFNPLTHKYVWYYASMWAQPHSGYTGYYSFSDCHLFQQVCSGVYIPGEVDLFKEWSNYNNSIYTSLNTGLTRSGSETHNSVDHGSSSRKWLAFYNAHEGLKPLSFYDETDLRNWIYHAYNGAWDGKTLVFSTYQSGGDVGSSHNGVKQRKVIIADFDGTQNIFNIQYSVFIEESNLYMGTGANQIDVKDHWLAIYWKGTGANHTRIYRRINGVWNTIHESFVTGTKPKIYKTRTGEYYLLTSTNSYYYNSNTNTWDTYSEMTVRGDIENDKHGFIPKKIVTSSSARKIWIYSEANETYNEIDVLAYTNSDVWRSAAADDSPGFGLRVAIWNGNKYNSGTNVEDAINVLKYEKGKFVNDENGLIRIGSNTTNLYGDAIYLKKNTIIYRSWSTHIRIYKKINKHWILTNHIHHSPGPYGYMGLHVYNNKMVHFDHESGGYGAGSQYQRVGSVSYQEFSSDYSTEFCNAIVPAVINDVTDTTNTKIGLYFSEDLVPNAYIDKNDFTINVNGSSASISSAEIIDGDVILTVSSAITNGQTVTIDYTANSDDMKKLKGYGTKYIKSFSSEAQDYIYFPTGKGWEDQTYNTIYQETKNRLRYGEGTGHLVEKRKRIGDRIYSTQNTNEIVSFNISRQKFDKIETPLYYNSGSGTNIFTTGISIALKHGDALYTNSATKIYKYVDATITWSTVNTSLSSPKDAFIYNNHFYYTTNSLTSLQKFDPATDTLTTVTITGSPPNVNGWHYYKVCQNNNELYFYVSHYSNKQPILYKIDLDTNSGTQIVFTASDDNVGYDSTKTSDSTYFYGIYNPATFYHGGNIYLVGGKRSNSHSGINLGAMDVNTIQKINLSEKIISNVDFHGHFFQASFDYSQPVVVGNEVYIWGPSDNTSVWYKMIIDKHITGIKNVTNNVGLSYKKMIVRTLSQADSNSSENRVYRTSNGIYMYAVGNPEKTSSDIITGDKIWPAFSWQHNYGSMGATLSTEYKIKDKDGVDKTDAIVNQSFTKKYFENLSSSQLKLITPNAGLIGDGISIDEIRAFGTGRGWLDGGRTGEMSYVLIANKNQVAMKNAGDEVDVYFRFPKLSKPKYWIKDLYEVAGEDYYYIFLFTAEKVSGTKNLDNWMTWEYQYDILPPQEPVLLNWTPQIENAFVEPGNTYQLILLFDTIIEYPSTLDHSLFTVKINGSSVSVTNAVLHTEIDKKNKITITLGVAPNVGDTMTVSYSKPTDASKQIGASNTRLIDSFTDVSVRAQTFKYKSRGLNYVYWSVGGGTFGGMTNSLFYGLGRSGSAMSIGYTAGSDQYNLGETGNANHWPCFQFKHSGSRHILSFIDFKDKNGNVRNEFLMTPKNFNEISADYISKGGNFGTGFDSTHGSGIYLNVFPNAGGSSGSPGGNSGVGNWNSYTGGAQLVIMWNDPRDIYVYFKAKKTAQAWNNVNSQLRFEAPDDNQHYYLFMFQGTFKKYDATNRDVQTIGQMLATWDGLNTSHSSYMTYSGSDDTSHVQRNFKAPKNVYDIITFTNSRLYSPIHPPWRDLQASDRGYGGYWDSGMKPMDVGLKWITETGHIGIPLKTDTFGPSPKKAYLHNINHSQVMLYFDEYLADGLVFNKNNWTIKIIDNNGTTNATISEIKYEANFALFKFEEVAVQSDVVNISYTAPTSVSSASIKDNKDNYVASFVDFSVENNLQVPASISSAETFSKGRKIMIKMSKNFKSTDYYAFVNPTHFTLNGSYTGPINVSDVIVNENTITLLCSGIFVKGEIIKLDYVPHADYNIALKDVDGTPMSSISNYVIKNNSPYDIVSELTCNASSSSGGSLEFGNSYKVYINKEVDVGVTLEWNGNTDFTSNILWSYGSSPWNIATYITDPQRRNTTSSSLYSVQENDYYIPHSNTSNSIKHAIEGTAGYKGYWFQFDMGSVVTIDNLWMLNGYSTTEGYKIKEIVICGSNDFSVTDTTYPFAYSGTWTYVDTIGNVNELMPHAAPWTTHTIDSVNIKFNSASYRYWRIIVTKHMGNHNRIEMWFLGLPKQIQPIINVESKNAIDDYKHRASGNIIKMGNTTKNYLTNEMIPYTGWNVNDTQFRAIYAEEKGPYNLAAMYGVRYYMGLPMAGYTASSMYNANYGIFKAFDNKVDNLYVYNYEYQHFMSGNSKYSSGNYTGTEKTGSNDYEGEWVQVDLIESYKVDSIVIHPRGGGSKTTGLPKDFKIFGSNDGSTWTEVLDISGLTNGDWNLNNGSGYTSHNSIGPYTLTNQTWRYWRLVVNKTINSAYFAIGQLVLLGNLNTAYRKHLFNYYSVVQNKWLKLGKIDQTAYIINNGTHSHSSTNSYPTTLPNQALILDSGDGDFIYPWEREPDETNAIHTGWIAGVTQSSSTETTDGYVGEWLQIEDSVKFKVEKITLLVAGHGGNINSPSTTWGPKNYRIYGSDDKVSWTQIIDQADLVHDDWVRMDNSAYGYSAPIIHTFSPALEYKVYRIVVNATISTSGSAKAHISRVRFYTPVDKTNDVFQNFKSANYSSPQTGGGEINALSMTHNLNSNVSKLLPVVPIYKKIVMKPKNWTIGQDPDTPANMTDIVIGNRSLSLRFTHATWEDHPVLSSTSDYATGSVLSDSEVFNSKLKSSAGSVYWPYNGTRQAFKQTRSNMNLYYDKEFVFYFWASDADAAENKYHILFSKKNTPTGQAEYYEWMNNYTGHSSYYGRPWYRGFPVKSTLNSETKEFNELQISNEVIGAYPVYGNIKGRQPAWRYIGEFSNGWRNQNWMMVTGKDVHLVGYNNANEEIFNSDSTDTWDRIRKSEIQIFETLPTLADPSIPQKPAVSKAALNVPNKVLITFTTNVIIGTPTLTDFRVKLNNKLLNLISVSLVSGKIEILFQESVIPHTDDFPQVVTVSYIKNEITDQQIGALLPVDTFIDSSVSNNLSVEAVNEITATVENSGITESEVTTKTETLIPANATRGSSGKYEFTNLSQSIAIVADDTPAKKRVRTKRFVKSIFTRIKALDNTMNTKTEGIKINREILAFTDEAKKKIKTVVRAFDVDSTIDTANIPEDESVYVPLENGQACTLIINSVTYRFIKQSTGTLVSPQINNKSIFNEGDIEVTGGKSIVFGSVSVQSEPAVIHIPIIFDLSGNMETFVSGDRWNPLYAHRHRFSCGGLGVAKVTANLFKSAFSVIQQRFEFTVTVVNDNGQNKYAFDGVVHDQLLLSLAQTYKFKPSPSDLFTNHPLRFSTTSDGTHGGGVQYNTGVSTTNTGDIMLSLPSTLNNTTDLYTNDASNSKIYYYCGAHSNMGNYFDVSEQQAIFTRNSDASCNALRDSFNQQLTTEGTSDIVHDISWSDIYTPEDTVDQGNTVYGYVKTRNNEDYTSQITSTNGNSVGEILLRYMSTHLTGHPLGQAFIKNDSAFINQVNGSGTNTANIANVLLDQMKLGLSENGTIGRGNFVLDTLFKQLKKQDPGRCGLTETKKDFPLLAGDKVIIYLAAKINVAADISKSIDNNNLAIAMTNEVFPNSKYPYMNDATGVLDAGTWMITLTIS